MRGTRARRRRGAKRDRLEEGSFSSISYECARNLPGERERERPADFSRAGEFTRTPDAVSHRELRPVPFDNSNCRRVSIRRGRQRLTSAVPYNFRGEPRRGKPCDVSSRFSASRLIKMKKKKRKRKCIYYFGADLVDDFLVKLPRARVG